MKNQNEVSRRQVLIASLSAAAVAPILAATGARAAGEKAEEKKKADVPEIDESKLVPSTNPIATALKYKHSAKDSTDRKAEKQGKPAAEQKCSNCALYVAPFAVLKGSKEAVGKCTMIAGVDTNYVKAEGWCTAWALKPGA
jgi:hypothetical protein